MKQELGGAAVCSVMMGMWDGGGREAQEEGNMCIIAGLLCHISEINTTL